MYTSHTVGNDVLLAVMLKSAKTQLGQHRTVSSVTAKIHEDRSLEIACLKTILKAHSETFLKALFVI